ncbi:hypothetical protein chiPu_0022176, partial [Chiloscyllium punctatum]|nr:hypothetical protein [Chiloscyllium punctatum]
SAENESAPDTKDSKESSERKIKVIASGRDDDSAENESSPDPK